MYFVVANSETGRLTSYVLIDSRILKTAGLVDLEGLLSIFLQKAEGLVDFGEILDSIGEVPLLTC